MLFIHSLCAWWLFGTNATATSIPEPRQCQDQHFVHLTAPRHLATVKLEVFMHNIVDDQATE
jgi:hypothetical protein